MKTINAKATNIFLALLGEMFAHDTLRIENDGYPVLLIRKTGEKIETEYGLGDTYNIAQLEGPVGKEKPKTEMGFVFIEKSTVHKGITKPKVVPCYYLNAISGLHETGIEFLDGKPIKTYPLMQGDQVGFANIWLLDLKAQGYLDKAE